jgi:hypothetical protein
MGHHENAGGIKQGTDDDDPHRAEAVGDRARKRLSGTIEQRLHRDRQREDLAVPAVGRRQRREEEAERRARPEPDHRDQAAAEHDHCGCAPRRGSTDHRRQRTDTVGPSSAVSLHRSLFRVPPSRRPP